MSRKLSALILFAAVSLTSISCSATPINKGPVSQRLYWGTKEQCVQFLQGPNAQAARWQVEAIGE